MHLVRLRVGVGSDAPQGARDELIAEPAVPPLAPAALEEVLVGVGRRELDEPPRAAVGGDVLADRLGDVRLAGARRPVEDELALLLEETKRLLQPRQREQQLLGERRGGRWEGGASRPCRTLLLLA